MLFSTKAEYGVRVLVELASHDGKTPLSLAEIAEQGQLPIAYLEHLVAKLKRAGIIESKRGARGGYLLAKPADNIDMASVIQALEGSLIPIECVGSSGSSQSGELESAAGGRGCPGFLPTENDPTNCSRVHHQPDSCPTKLLWTQVQAAIVQSLQQTTLADLLLKQRALAAA